MDGGAIYGIATMIVFVVFLLMGAAHTERPRFRPAPRARAHEDLARRRSLTPGDVERDLYPHTSRRRFK